jgi:bromodomain-containing factor 1
MIAEETPIKPIEVLDLSNPSDPAVKPINNVESGIQPLASFVGELENIQEPVKTDSTAGMQEAAVPQTEQHDMGNIMNGKMDAEEKMDVNGEAHANGLVHANGETGANGTAAVNGTTDINGNMDVDSTMNMNDDSNGVTDVQTADTLPAISTLDGASDVPDAFPNLETEDISMIDATPSIPTKVAREREDDDEGEPSAKRARTEETVAPDTNGVHTVTSDTPALPTTEQPSSEPAPMDSAATAPPSEPSVAAPHQPPVIDFGPMTEVQFKVIEPGMRNLKKSRQAVFFQKPVDPVAMNLPTYFTVIKHPMDLSTMEQKLKNREYNSVNEYVADFDLMVQNSVTFNGHLHTVSQAGSMLRSQLDAQLRKVPRPGHVAPAAEQSAKKKKKLPAPAPVQELKQRRQSKPHLPPPAAPIAALPPLVKEDTYALDTNGMPQIRRMSTSDGRPKREIKAPARELPYSAKPKKKKYQAELKFCQEILDEFRKPRWGPSIAPFSVPVDPVALNIPNYRSIVKKPMDISTITEKLGQGHYENAKEFEADFRLMCDNCYKFNGKEHVVSKMAQDLEAQLTTSMSKKNEWLAKHAPRSSPQSADAGSDSEEEDEDEEEDGDDPSEQFAMINKQMQQLSEQLMALQQQKGKKPKEKKSKSTSKSSKKTSMGGGGASARSDKKSSKSKSSTKPRPISTVQKEEISTKIGELDNEGISAAADLIKNGLRKAGKHAMADAAEHEMEFEIDEIPDETLHDLLRLVRRGTNAEQVEPTVEDTEYKPAKNGVSANSGKTRKNKPMSKFEQEKRIAELKGRIANFDSGAGQASSPDGESSECLGVHGEGANVGVAGQAAAESSGDDDESGSESEEE